ncbi:hypothetical protein A1O1_05684 [Capronia coronata CBS 617.96]|uniref:C2H2-type domain-containing protein n=1 Tax=Capronia coronata CBS 617.96 TaxID=1182541 RepID=W9Y6R2_9EURO|nr:uncharacterized protein A1O1_05684 [Capronia coronata CBS 617.96]EXJ85320.1 hypothetical protein A1O1_05684 [Capronia coronata CBS 617.96]
MSVAIAIPSSISMDMTYQPFQCQVCHVRFTRNENLKRHTALHSRSPEDATLRCEYCATTFSRPDLRRRHMKKLHALHDEGRAAKRRRREPSVPTPESNATGSQSPRREIRLFESAAEDHHSWIRQQSRSPSSRYGQSQVEQDRQRHHDNETVGSSDTTNGDGGGSQVEAATLPQISTSIHVGHHIPDANDIEQSLLLGASLLSPSNHLGTSTHSGMTLPSRAYSANQLSSDFNPRTLDSLSSKDLRSRPLWDDWFPSSWQIARGVDLYFRHISPYVPFLHQPTFDVAQTADYLVLSMLSLAYQHGEDPDSGDATNSGVSLSVRCFHRARVLVDSREEKVDDWTRGLTMTRAYLLLQLCAMLYLCGENSAYGLRMHSKMIFLARSERLMQPLPPKSGATEDLESLWREFVKVESYKRTLFAMHQIDALWYQLLSIPRSLSHLEFKHELPCPDNCWTATSAAQWAHRCLLNGQSGPPVQYGDAVRRFLSDDLDIDCLPAFDPYGAVNIAQFLISSAREITGWSTMTGRLCIERFEPLRSSLEALRPLIRHDDATVTSTHPALCEATWEMAMIELLMWSPAHTGGIVGGSIDAVLEHSTHLTPSWEFLVETNTAKTIQPHVDWFLCYLDATLTPDSEPPWVAVYAYRAFLIAWQLVRGGSLGAMQVVGVEDGDIDGAMLWARKVFKRRQRLQLGKLIVSCLDILSK